MAESLLVADDILLRPIDVVNRNSIADRIAANFAAMVPLSEDAGRSEEEIMEDAIAEVAASRRDRRDPEA